MCIVHTSGPGCLKGEEYFPPDKTLSFREALTKPIVLSTG